MTAPHNDTLVIPVPLTTLLDQAEERHAAAMRDAKFHHAEQWAKIRDALVDLIYESGAGR